MAWVAGLEPATDGFEGHCSILLSHTQIQENLNYLLTFSIIVLEINIKFDLKKEFRRLAAYQSCCPWVSVIDWSLNQP